MHKIFPWGMRTGSLSLFMQEVTQSIDYPTQGENYFRFHHAFPQNLCVLLGSYLRNRNFWLIFKIFLRLVLKYQENLKFIEKLKKKIDCYT